MTLPPNFGRALDLSGLGKPAPQKPSVKVGKEVTAANLASEFLTLSRTKPVVIICWSSRSPESLVAMETLGKINEADSDKWSLGTVDVDAEAKVAQALQVRAVPFAIALIKEELLPLFEQNYPEPQIRAVIEKVLSIAAEQGIGALPEEVMEPEEEEALVALEAGNYDVAEDSYKKLLLRKPNDSFAKLGLAQTQLLIRTKGLNPAEVAIAAGASPNDLNLQLQCADCEIANGDVDSAFARLLRCVRTMEGEEQGRAKSHLLQLFLLVDPNDPRLLKARSALASALF